MWSLRPSCPLALCTCSVLSFIILFRMLLWLCVYHLPLGPLLRSCLVLPLLFFLCLHRALCLSQILYFHVSPCQLLSSSSHNSTSESSNQQPRWSASTEARLRSVLHEALEAWRAARRDDADSNEFAVLAVSRRRARDVCNLHFEDATRTLPALHHRIPLSKLLRISKLALDVRDAAELFLK